MTRLPLYECGDHYVIQTPKGFEVYRREATAAVRCATIGYRGDKGMSHAIAQCQRRERESAS